MSAIRLGSYEFSQTVGSTTYRWNIRIGGSEVSAEFMINDQPNCTLFAFTSLRSGGGSHIEATCTARLGASRNVRTADFSSQRKYKITLDDQQGSVDVVLTPDADWKDNWPTRATATYLSSNYRSCILRPIVDRRLNPSGGNMIAGEIRQAVDDAVQFYSQVGINMQPQRFLVLNGVTDSSWTIDDLRQLMDQSVTGVNYSAREGFDGALFFLQGFSNDGKRTNPTTTGWMFDDNDNCPRQGAAVFRSAFSNEELRTQLGRTSTHEIGHMFNLVHSFTADGSGSNSASCMNYPQNYTGSGNYWPAYQAAPLKFAEREVRWMCHGHLDDVAMGGNRFRGTDPAYDIESRQPSRPPVSSDGMELRLSVTPHSRSNVFEFGEPVTVLARLSSQGRVPHVRAIDALDPTHYRTTYLIRSNRLGLRQFRPIGMRCGERKEVALTPSHPAIYEAVSLTYGSDGFYFTEPGWYYITAVYDSAGIGLSSNTLDIYVRHPTRAEEDAIVPTFTARVGECLSCWGSQRYSPESLNECQNLLTPPWEAHPLRMELIRGATLASLRGGRSDFVWRGPQSRKHLTYKYKSPHLSRADLTRVLNSLGWNEQLTGAKKKCRTWRNGREQHHLPTIYYCNLASALACYLKSGSELSERFPNLARDLVESIANLQAKKRSQAMKLATGIPRKAWLEWKKRSMPSG